MTDQRIDPETLVPERIDPEMVANEQRKAREEAREDDDKGVIGTAERVVDSLVRPLSADRPSEDQIEEQRDLNDLEQRS